MCVTGLCISSAPRIHALLTLYRDGKVRSFHNLNADWATVSRHPRVTSSLKAREGRRVIAPSDQQRRVSGAVRLEARIEPAASQSS
jgi:hypothetical protein